MATASEGARGAVGLCVGLPKEGAWGWAWYLNRSCMPCQWGAGTPRLAAASCALQTASSLAVDTGFPQAASRGGSAAHACSWCCPRFAERQEPWLTAPRQQDCSFSLILSMWMLHSHHAERSEESAQRYMQLAVIPCRRMDAPFGGGRVHVVCTI
jgi:hypothetical protein